MWRALGIRRLPLDEIKDLRFGVQALSSLGGLRFREFEFSHAISSFGRVFWSVVLRIPQRVLHEDFGR